MTTTITEALAEIKTINARLTKKRDFVLTALWRQNVFKDPYEKDGGSAAVINRERQAIGDLESRIVSIRSAIAAKNASTKVTVLDDTKTVADWLVWRRDVAPNVKSFLDRMRTHISKMRADAQSKGIALVQVGAEPSDHRDIIVNVSESGMHAEIEKLEETLGALDGKLSLHNATAVIDV